MTKKEIIQLVRQHISDEQATAFTEGGNLEEPAGTKELIIYLDRAVDAYSRRQVSAGDIRLLKEAALKNGDLLPVDFLAFAGNVPISVAHGYVRWFYPFAGGERRTARYFARLPYVSAYGDNDALDYQHDQEIAIAALAAIYALNKHEANVSQDLMLLGMGEANANTGQ